MASHSSKKSAAAAVGVKGKVPVMKTTKKTLASPSLPPPPSGPRIVETSFGRSSLSDEEKERLVSVAQIGTAILYGKVSKDGAFNPYHTIEAGVRPTWRPMIHFCFPQHVKQDIFHFLLVATHYSNILNNDIKLIICKFIATP